jgi:hypothetical protein
MTTHKTESRVSLLLDTGLSQVFKSPCHRQFNVVNMTVYVLLVTETGCITDENEM